MSAEAKAPELEAFERRAAELTKGIDEATDPEERRRRVRAALVETYGEEAGNLCVEDRALHGLLELDRLE